LVEVQLDILKLRLAGLLEFPNPSERTEHQRQMGLVLLLRVRPQHLHRPRRIALQQNDHLMPDLLQRWEVRKMPPALGHKTLHLLQHPHVGAVDVAEGQEVDEKADLVYH
jgi:hypothetical protein